MRAAVALLILATSACDSSAADNLIEAESLNVVETLTTENIVANDVTAVDASSEPPLVPTRAHNYDFKEGNTYGYFAAISEEDRKRGKAAPDAAMFQYKGYWDGLYHLDQVDGVGRVISVSECSDPCVAIKTYEYGRVERVAFRTTSIIGAAFEDAIKGRLVDARKLERARQPEIEPTAAEENPFGGYNTLQEQREAKYEESNAAE